MKLKIIACKPMEKDLLRLADLSIHDIDVQIIPMDYHEKCEELKGFLQDIIDNVTEGYDALLLCYGLCSNSTSGLVAKHMPVVLIKAHDCVTFSLGSKERYAEIFAENSGTYYFTTGWLDTFKDRGPNSSFFIFDDNYRDKRLAELAEMYGEDNALFLLDAETSWIANYNRALFIRDDSEETEDNLRVLNNICENLDWELKFERKDDCLLNDLLNMNWTDDQFIVLYPNEEVYETGDNNIMSKRIAVR